MATFKAGQRVRIKFCFNPQIYGDSAGKEGTVTGHIKSTHGMANAVFIDGWPELRPNGDRRAFLDEQLELIQYDGNKIVEWSECLWQPEHLRATA